MDGVVRTAVGYMGGRTSNPTYHDLADHAEAVEVHFDPELISYEALLAEFWNSHVPTHATRSTQYRAALFINDVAQREMAEASRDALQKEIGAPVRTEILGPYPFHPAEDYHQKWRLRRCTELWNEAQAFFPDEPSLLASTTAAKLNGLVGGTQRDLVERYIDQLGLSEKGRRILTNGGR